MDFRIEKRWAFVIILSGSALHIFTLQELLRQISLLHVHFRPCWMQLLTRERFHTLGPALKGGKIGTYKFRAQSLISKKCFCFLAASTVMCAVKAHLIKTC